MELILDRVTKQYKNKIAVDRLSTTLTEGVYCLQIGRASCRERVW